MKKMLLAGLALLMVLPTVAGEPAPRKKAVPQVKAVKSDDPMALAIQFAESEMIRFPKAYQMDHSTRPYFGYTVGLGSCAMMKMWQATGEQKYYDYVAELADTLIGPDGSIDTYRQEPYNLDMINSGNYLFYMYEATKDARYKKAMETLLKQLASQPRTTDGGFWHKLIYPHQMWLDGLYMASPFMAHYGAMFQRREWVDEALQQVITIHRHTYDPQTGLCHHAWDEAAQQYWSDAEGHSPNFWGRSEGWYFMALVDILDYVPEGYTFRLKMGHKDTVEVNGHDSLVAYIQELVDVLPRYQRGGLWYQVLDCPEREGNWPEATVTCQFMYAVAKAVNKGYIDPKYAQIAWDAYYGMQQTQITDARSVNEEGKVTGDHRDPGVYPYGAQHAMLLQLPDGTLSLTHCCAVGGLGTGHKRDGSFHYYTHERIRDNDAKGNGPFIMGCLELAKLSK